MFTKILQWFDRSDDWFLSLIQNPLQKEKYIKQLRHSRLNYALLFCLSSVALLVALFSNLDMGASIIVFVIGLLGYLDADSKIKLIRAIELFCPLTNVDEIETNQTQHPDR